MKDLYSAHTSQEDLDKFYEEVKSSYVKIFKRLGFDVVVTEAAGGVFTDSVTHEFQVISATGEDEIIYCPGGDFSQNTEIAKVKEGKQCDLGHGPLKKVRAIEVGNIFRFGTSYSEKMNVSYSDNSGKKQFAYLGSYGIGITRLIGVLVELFNDDRGIIWPKEVAPYSIHLLNLGNVVYAQEIYKELKAKNIEVLWDDRDSSAGEKFADADLIGIPYRILVSDKLGAGKIELKARNSDKSEIIVFEELIKRVS